jgi:tetratricopeptide (TPR) repeat protein
MASVHLKKEEYLDAEISYREALMIQYDLKDVHGASRSLNDIGKVYIEMKDYPKAKGFFMDSLKMRRKHNLKQAESTTLIDLVKLMMLMEDMDSAANYIKEAHEVLAEHPNQTKLALLLETKAAYYEAIGDTAQAATAQQEYQDLQAARSKAI